MLKKLSLVMVLASMLNSYGGEIQRSYTYQPKEPAIETMCDPARTGLEVYFKDADDDFDARKYFRQQVANTLFTYYLRQQDFGSFDRIKRFYNKMKRFNRLKESPLVKWFSKGKFYINGMALSRDEGNDVHIDFGSGLGYSSKKNYFYKKLTRDLELFLSKNELGIGYKKTIKF